MRRQNSEQFHKLRNFWKITKELEMKELDPALSPTNNQSLKSSNLQRFSKDASVQQKWNSPIPSKPTISLFNKESLQDQPERKQNILLSSLTKLDDSKMTKVIRYIEHVSKPEVLEEPPSHHDTILPQSQKISSEISEKPVQTYRVKRTEKLRKRTSHVFEILLMSNWGDPEYIGLNCIEFFNELSKKIKISSSSVSVKHSSYYLDPSLLVKKIKGGKEIWISAVSTSEKCVRVIVRVAVENNICGIKIWNYNKNGLESRKGVKELEVRFNHEKIWKGELAQYGHGEDCAKISLLAGFKFADLDTKVLKAVSSMVRIVNAPPGSPKPKFSGSRKYIRSDIKLEASLGVSSRLNVHSQAQLRESYAPSGSPKPTKFNRKYIRSDIKLQSTLGHGSHSSLHSQAELRDSEPLKIEDLCQNVIPDQPQGRVLRLNLLSTWGDQNYIGLCGIEFWDSNGNAISFPHAKIQISGHPSGLAVLPEYKEDIRTLDKLVDGVYRTCDDSHAWLAPYHPGESHYILIDFLQPVTLSLIRIWNFNKSRILSYRGVKDIEIFFDDKHFIFKGRLQKAPGTVRNAEQHCEYIILTQSQSVLQKIIDNDWVDRQEDEGLEFTEAMRLDIDTKVKEERANFTQNK